MRARPAQDGGRFGILDVERARRLAPRLRGAAADVICLEPVDPVALRSLYAACDALVLPSIPTRTFREPWGLVVN